MATADKLNLGNYLASLVKQGVCKDDVEAQKVVCAELLERELDQELAQADIEIENKDYDDLDNNFIKQFTKKMADKYLPHN